MHCFHRATAFAVAVISALVFISPCLAGAPAITGAELSEGFNGAVSSVLPVDTQEAEVNKNSAALSGSDFLPDSYFASVAASSAFSEVYSGGFSYIADIFPALIPPPASVIQSQAPAVQSQASVIQSQASVIQSQTPAVQAGASVPEAEVPAVQSVAASGAVIPIRLNTTVTAALAGASSTLTYTFTLTKRGCITLDLTRNAGALAADTGWIVSLYEEYFLNGSDGQTGMRLLTKLKTDATEQTSRSAEIGVLPGSFKVVVTSDKNFRADNFSLRVGFAESDSFEIEYNDTLTRYTNIYADKPISGSSALRDDTNTDTDYYMFRVQERGYVEVSFSHADKSLTSVGWRVSVVDANGTEYYSSTSRLMDTHIESGAIGLVPGCYFIKVQGHVYCPVSYTLELSVVETPNFETELNDSLAMSISTGTPFYGATTSRSGASDRDYYSFSLPSNGYITVKFEHEPSVEVRSGWNIRLYDSKNTLLYSGVADWSVESTVSQRIGLAKGSYYLRIDSENLYLNSSIYTGTINFTADNAWEKEPNNTFTNSTVLASGASVTGAMLEVGVEYDTDCYKIVCSDGPLSINFAHEALPEEREGWIITLYDSNGNRVAPTDAAGNVYTNVLGSVIYTTACSWNKANTIAYYHRISAGTYYIKVETGLYYSYINYTLSY